MSGTKQPDYPYSTSNQYGATHLAPRKLNLRETTCCYVYAEIFQTVQTPYALRLLPREGSGPSYQILEGSHILGRSP